MDTLNISTKIGLSNDSWAFRFMLDSQQAYRDFIKYFKHFGPQQEHFSIKEKEIPLVASIYALFPPAERMRVLQQAVEHTYTYRDAFVSQVAEKLLMQSNMSVGECVLLLKVAPVLNSHTEMMLIQKAHSLMSSKDFFDLLDVETLQHDMLLSYYLIHGDNNVKEQAQRIIVRKNKGASMGILDYAVKKGWVSSLEDELTCLIDNFRNGDIHKTAFKKLKQHPEQIAERIAPSDPIFNYKYQYSSEFFFAISCLFIRYPNEAKVLFEEHKKHLSVFQVYAAGDILWNYPELASSLVNQLYAVKTQRDAKIFIDILIRMPESWKKNIIDTLASRPTLFSSYSIVENTLLVALHHMLSLPLPNIHDVFFDDDCVEVLIKQTPYQQLLSWKTFESMKQLGLSLPAILQNIQLTTTITPDEVEIFL